MPCQNNAIRRSNGEQARRLNTYVAIALSAGFLSFAGCASSRDVARYRAILDGKTPITIDYKTDEPLSLTRALQLADADNEAIGIAGENYVQALSDKMRDAGTFLPTLSLAPTYSLTKGGGSSGFIIGGSGFGTTTGGSTSTGTTGSTSTGTVQITSGQGDLNHSFSVPLNASVTGSLANASTLAAAGQTVDQRALLLLDERETILLQVVTSYYNVLKDEHQVAVYEDNIRLKSEKVRDQLARLKLGAVRPLDLATSQSDLAATRVSLTQSKTDAANARSALARLMGVTEVRGTLTDSFDPPADLQTVSQWQATAVVRRQDLLASVRAVEAAKFKVEAAIREYFPSVTINFNYFLYNDPTSSQKWTGGLSGNFPLFSALTIEADIRSAWSVYRQAGLTALQNQRQVMDDITEGFQNVQNSREKIVELTTEVDAAQQAADLAERAYKLGSESNLDRLTQQDNLITAKLNLVSEQFNLKSSYLTLLRASGGLATALK